MSSDRNKVLLDSVRRLMRRGAETHLRKIVNKTHGADLSAVFRSLTVKEQQRLFGYIDDIEQKGLLLSELDETILVALTESIKVMELAKILDRMPADDVAGVIDKLPPERAQVVLEKMGKEDSEEVEGLLGYGEDTAGRIMIPDFIALRENNTIEEAIASLQKEYSDVEMPFYLYVLNEYGQLVGVSSLRQLVVHPAETLLKDFMDTDVFSVTTDTDQEEVAKIVARYDILAVPVVDDNNRLVGIVTVDDVIDVFRREATEDILKMAGVGEEFIETQSVVRSTRIRLPWLFASYIGGVLAFFIIGSFESTLSKVASLAAFIPVIMGMGGNIGTQSSTIVVRGLATGRLNIRDIWTVVSKELAIGVILGLFYGLLIGVVAKFSSPAGTPSVPLAVSVGVALVSSMSIAALVGSLVPMCLARMHIDPAVATGPFVTTSIDIISVFFYFKIATTIIGL